MRTPAALAAAGVLVAALAATPAAATTCEADVIRLVSGPFILIGSSDAPDLVEVYITDLQGNVLQTIPLAEAPYFAEAVRFPVQVGDTLRAMFVDVYGTVCVDTVVVAGYPPVVPTDTTPTAPDRHFPDESGSDSARSRGE
jgi:hypothetical protein